MDEKRVDEIAKDVHELLLGTANKYQDSLPELIAFMLILRDSVNTFFDTMEDLEQEIKDNLPNEEFVPDPSVLDQVLSSEENQDG
jgi:hypothetical protein